MTRSSSRSLASRSISARSMANERSSLSSARRENTRTPTLARVVADARARDYTHLDSRAGDAWRQPQRGVANIRGLLAEDGAQQFLFWRHRRFALRRDC